MKIFVDTGPLKALFVPRDQFRKKTIITSEQLITEKAQLITTDHILSETFTLLLTDMKAGHHRVKQFAHWIFKKQPIQIEWVDKERFLKTKDLFLKVSKDKRWSFTDCTSFVVMKELKINTAFTFDSHYKQMGFEVLE